VKIGALSGSSRIANAEVEEVAHMLFAPGISRFFATHPDLEARLKAIDPRFDKREFVEAELRLAAAPAETEAAVAPAKSARERLEDVIHIPAAAQMAALVANPTPAHMEVAHRIRESLPDTLVAASHRPDSARALLFALALETDAAARDRQLLYVGQQLGAQVAAATTGLLTEVAALAPEQRLPVLLGSFPALRQLTREERLQLMACLNGMLQREGRPSLQVYALRKLAQVHLRDDLEAHARIGKLTLSAVTRETARTSVVHAARRLAAADGHGAGPTRRARAAREGTADRRTDTDRRARRQDDDRGGGNTPCRLCSFTLPLAAAPEVRQPLTPFCGGMRHDRGKRSVVR
jgi:hypothetical protein